MGCSMMFGLVVMGNLLEWHAILMLFVAVVAVVRLCFVSIYTYLIGEMSLYGLGVGVLVFVHTSVHEIRLAGGGFRS